MKMKKALSLVLAASLALTSLAACGGGSDEEQASNSDTFKIGGIGPTTGDAAAYGTAVQNGAQLAVDEINEAGGINGKQIEFQFEDDQNNSEKSVNAYNTLKIKSIKMRLPILLMGLLYGIGRQIASGCEIFCINVAPERLTGKSIRSFCQIQESPPALNWGAFLLCVRRERKSLKERFFVCSYTTL